MDQLITTVSWVLGTISIVLPILWLLDQWNDRNNRHQFKLRNLKYVKFSNLFTSTFYKRRIEIERHEMVERVGKVFGFTQLFNYNILIAEPELCQLILSKEFATFTNRRKINIPDEMFANSLTIVRDEQWKRIRSIITPSFSSGKIRRMKPIIDSAIETMEKNFDNSIEQSDIVDMKQIFNAFTMDTIIQTSFGIRVNSLGDKNNPIIANAMKLITIEFSTKILFQFAMLIMFPRLSKLLNIQFKPEIIGFFKKLSTEIIEKKQAELDSMSQEQKQHYKPNNFIELMLEAQREEENVTEKENNNNDDDNAEVVEGGDSKKSAKYITNNEIIAQCILFFFAGFETTSSALTMATYLLALNPEKQDKLYAEIETVLKQLEKKSNNDTKSDDDDNEDIDKIEDDPLKLVTFESLEKFEYLAAVMDETLRLYSPAPFQERQASDDITLETEDGRLKVNVKKDDIIQIQTYSIHRDSEQFPEPELFLPERFIEEPLKSTFHKYAYQPFGLGPRNCIARRFALFEAKLALLHSVYRYRFSVCDKTQVPVQFYYQNNILSPRDVYLKMEKRQITASEGHVKSE